MMLRGTSSVNGNSENEDNAQFAFDYGVDPMVGNLQKPTFRWEWNINTLAVVFGFIISFIGWGYQWSSFNERQAQNTESIAELKANNTSQDARLSALELIQARSTQVDYKIDTLEKAQEALDSRMTRISDSYSNQFADFRTQLSAISTQIALVQQSQARIENYRTSAQDSNK